jgi:hypothetical protein
VRKMFFALALVAVAVDLSAATLVLKGGKRIEVASYAVQGSYVVVKQANGRLESYPLSVVDLAASNAASAAKPPAPPSATPTPVGPHSPFLAAKAVAGGSALIVTDADVAKIKAPEEEGGGVAAGGNTGAGPGQVVMGGYEKTQLDNGDWEIAVTAKNPGAAAVQAVNVTVRALDAAGTQLAATTGTLPGVLEGGSQGVITVHLATASEPIQLGFDFNWKTMPPPATPSPTAKPAQAAPAAAAAKPAAAAVAPGGNPGLYIPRGSSPNTVPSNPMGITPPNQGPAATPGPQQRPPA